MLAGFLHRWDAILADQERKPSPKPEPEDLLQASDSQRLILPARAREPEPEPPSHRERVLDRADDSPAAASGTPSSPSSSCRSKAVKLNVHLNFEDGWRVLEQGIVTCSKILEGSTGTRPTVAEYTNCYDCAYRMAVQTTSYCEEMYSGFKATLAESVRVLVLPHLMHKRDDDLLRQLLKMWSNYCTMVNCISGFFSCLDSCFVEQRKLPCLEDAAATSFFATVFSFNHEIADALLTLIRQERDGRKVDMDLLMAIMRGICRSEVKPSMKHAFLQDTYAYYSRKGSEWIVQYPLQDYLAKVQDTVEKETMRLMHYLCIPEGDCSELCLKVVSAPLMQTYDSYAKEKQIGGQLLLQTYKTVEDDLLARCNRLTIDSSSDNSSASYME